MDPIYVFGHRNPDTDSVVSAMAYAALNNSLGSSEYVAARLGHLNDETAFLLERFGFEPPLYMTTVRTQVRDIEFDRPPTLSSGVAVSRAWDVLRENVGLSAVPVTDEHGGLFGMVTAGGIAEKDMDSIQHPAIDAVPVFNLLSALEGLIINDESDVFDCISGEVTIALPCNGGDVRGIKEGSVVICGHQEDVVALALEKQASCVILCQTDLAEKYRGISSRTCIIATPCDAYRAARMIYQAIPVGRIAQIKNIVHFHMDDYIDDVRDAVLQSLYRS